MPQLRAFHHAATIRRRWKTHGVYEHSITIPPFSAGSSSPTFPKDGSLRGFETSPIGEGQHNENRKQTPQYRKQRVEFDSVAARFGVISLALVIYDVVTAARPIGQ